ncbi:MULTISPECIES: aldo/keto reductase [Bacillaceae]|uniref:aldo/keto reductase n=1 Tax=Bacillaceae TaxID=186817 RepID=UPI00215995C4|nr:MULTISPECIES: aldo/keto reductase [Bacillaceae]
MNREEIVISTKAGIIPGDIDIGLVPKKYLQKILLDTAIVEEADLHIVGNQRHVLAPSYYQFAIEQSRKHLGINTIDIHYIHNPELSMRVLSEEAFYKQLEVLFLFYEEQVSKGNIRYYGFATWNGLLCDPEEQGYISLEKVMKTLLKVVGVNHHFKFLQFPYNKIIHYAKTRRNQQVNQQFHTVLDAAKEFGLITVTSAPFNLGKLIDRDCTPNDHLLSILGEQNISSVMVGMKHLNHVINNLRLIQIKH